MFSWLKPYIFTMHFHLHLLFPTPLFFCISKQHSFVVFTFNASKGYSDFYVWRSRQANFIEIRWSCCLLCFIIQTRWPSLIMATTCREKKRRRESMLTVFEPITPETFTDSQWHVDGVKNESPLTNSAAIIKRLIHWVMEWENKRFGGGTVGWIRGSRL